VDSGNLAGHLLTLRAGLLALGDDCVLPVRLFEGAETLPTLREVAAAGSVQARERMSVIDRLARQAGDLARMDYDFLFDKTRRLLTIGYNVTERRADTGYYDLLASEARLCNFVAIAQGQLPQESWFALGRLLTGTAASRCCCRGAARCSST
jgi:hypothetical protein